MSDRFGEMWFGPESQKVLARLAESVAHLDGSIVEVGCWTGRSTVALANAVHPEHVRAVDTWNGSPGEISEQLAAERDVYEAFARNVEDCTGGNVDPYRMDWRTYFAEHSDPVKFCHIDAAHTYDEVADNIRAVLPLLVPGGIICGDDNHHPPVQHAVLDTLGNATIEATLWWWQC